MFYIIRGSVCLIAVWLLLHGTTVRGQSEASRIRLIKIEGKTLSNGLQHPIIRLATHVRVKKSDNDRTNTNIETIIEIPGQLADVSGRELKENNEGTVAAITFQPATKTHFTLLIVNNDTVGLTVDVNFNRKIAALCRRLAKAVNPDDILVKSVRAKIITLISYVPVLHGYRKYQITVLIHDNLRLDLLTHGEVTR